VSTKAVDLIAVGALAGVIAFCLGLVLGTIYPDQPTPCPSGEVLRGPDGEMLRGPDGEIAHVWVTILAINWNEEETQWTLVEDHQQVRGFFWGYKGKVDDSFYIPVDHLKDYSPDHFFQHGMADHDRRKHLLRTKEHSDGR